MALVGSSPCYERHRPEDTVLYRTIESHLEAFLARASEHGGDGLPAFVTRELRAYLRCGRPEHGCVQEKLRFGVREVIRRRKPDSSRPAPDDRLGELSAADAIVSGIGD